MNIKQQRHEHENNINIPSNQHQIDIKTTSKPLFSDELQNPILTDFNPWNKYPIIKINHKKQLKRF